MQHKKSLGIGLILALVTVAAYGAAGFDRMRDHVKVGQGAAGAKLIEFDSGDGANNAKITTTDGDNMSVATGGSTRVTVADATVTTTVPVLTPAGTASLPAYSFSADPNTGIWNAAADQVGITAGGTTRVTIDGDGSGTDYLTSTLRYAGPAGTASLPAYSFSADPNTGIWNAAADQVGITAGGTTRVTIDGDGSGTDYLTSTLRLVTPDGTNALPSYSFTSDPDTGLSIASTDKLRISAGGDAKLDISNALGSGGSNVDMVSTNTNVTTGDGLARFRVISSDTSNTGSVASQIRTIADSATGDSTRLEFNVANAGTDTNMVTIDKDGLGIGTAPTSRLNVNVPDGWNSTTYATVMVNAESSATQGNVLLVEGGSGNVGSNIARFNNNAGTRIMSVGGQGLVSISSSGALHNADPGGNSGNVPHECVTRSSSASALTVTVACSAGEIATGGGCDAIGGGSLAESQPNPTSGTPTGWTCQQSSGTNSLAARAICCAY